MNEGMKAPVYDWEEVVEYISQRCDVRKEDVEKVLVLEEEYMRSVGIIKDIDGFNTDTEIDTDSFIHKRFMKVE